ncbi:hypothetical protein GCM10010182_14500 [Actinomadura cremea]|nr:hypothetical protein GCM10010182_14500 [Actinomadura cremea]
MKRTLIAVPALAIALAAGGCGGSDGGGDAGATAPAPGTSAPSGAPEGGGAPPSGNGTAGGGGPAAGGMPSGAATSNATKAFNDCMAGQGVRMPTPTPGTTPSKAQIDRVRKAMEACVEKFSTDPPAG